MSATPLAMPRKRPTHGFYIVPSTLPTQQNTKAGKPRKRSRTRPTTPAVTTAAA